MPAANTVLKFENYQKCVEHPFAIYCDFEAINCPIHIHSGNTLKQTEHKPSSFCAMRISSHEPHSSPPFLYRGKKCMQEFLHYLERQRKQIEKILQEKQKPMKWDREAKERAKGQTHCYLCNKLLRYKYERFRDHDHLSGIFRGMSCNVCNLKYSSLYQLKIPIIMHNASGYDLHFIIRRLHLVKENVTVIPKNTEQYLALQLGTYVFIDSFQFLNEGLASLASNLRDKGKEAFHYLNRHVHGAEKQGLLLQKGVFCYRYLDSHRKFHDKQLPPIESFYNDLEQKSLPEERYEHAKKVWSAFDCQTLGDYHDLYLKSDLLILVDVFQNFRQFCLQYYRLDPAHYLTGPQLCYDALLKLTGVKLELVTDIDMFNLLERGIRGGVAQIMQRAAEANNPYMENYQPSIESSYLFYIDQNSLYSHIMQDYNMPTGNFKWLTEHEIQCIDPASIPDEGDTGYIFEVTLEYPEHLHDIQAHSDFPLACEKMAVQDQYLSPMMKTMREMFNMKTSSKAVKLIPNFRTKHKYVIHYKNLKLYVELGLRLVKIHRAIRFDQRKWMAPYIRFNIDQRQKAKSNFESQLFKRFNNAIFGKCMENLKKRTHIRLAKNPQQFERYSSMPTFRSCKIIHKQLTSVQLSKPVVRLDRPIYVGFCILDLAKLKMYDFHYNYMARKYGDKARLIFTDTDSFIYWIQTGDLYSDIAGDDEYDFSNYPPDHPTYSTLHKKEPGWMKDESAGAILESFVGLRSKMYSLRHERSHASKDAQKAKGIKKSAIRTISHDDYLDCLLNVKQMRHSFHAIRSQRHVLYTIKQKKLSLSCYDDKRYLLNCNIHSLPYGHYALKRTGDDAAVGGGAPKRRKCDECQECRGKLPVKSAGSTTC